MGFLKGFQEVQKCNKAGLNECHNHTELALDTKLLQDSHMVCYIIFSQSFMITGEGSSFTQ